MDKPGPGTPVPQIIDDPKLRSPLRKFMEGSVTVALWAVWIYFVMPVLTILLWVLGFRVTYTALTPKHGIWELVDILRGAGITLAAIFALNLIWMYYNLKVVSHRPKMARKYGEASKENAPLKPAGENNRIEIVLDADGPRVVSATRLH